MSSIQHGKNVPRRSNSGSKKSGLKWMGFGVLALAIAFGVTVLILNMMTYSPSGLVQGYLSAVSQGEATKARNYPGIELTGDMTQFMSSGQLNRLENVEIVSDTALSDGVHEVVASYTLLDDEGNSTPSQTAFLVQPGDKIFGLFDEWVFAKNPVATLNVSVSNDWRFNVNQQQVAVVGGVPNEAQSITVLVPNLYQLEHVSNYFTSSVMDVPATEVGQQYHANLTLEPTEEFNQLIASELHSYLDQCATQTVLQPTGCPFGQYLSDTVVDEPHWTISQYPEVSFEPDAQGWFIPPTNGSATLDVTMQSIFDGVQYHYNDAIDFTVSYLIQPDDNGNYRIIEQLVG